MVTFVCSTCNKFAYRAIRDAGPGEKLTEADFIPVEGQTTPLSPGIRPTCDACGTPLRAAAERPKQPVPPSNALSNGANPARNGGVPAAPGSMVVALFCVEPGEEITSIKELFGGDRLLVITTRRIVLIHTSEVPV